MVCDLIIDYNNHITFKGFHWPVNTLIITSTSKESDNNSTISNT